jgi:hypothetical protein
MLGGPARSTTIVALVLCVSAAGRASSEDAAPSKGGLESLTCRVTKVEPVARTIDASIVTVEVRNAGTASAEPVAFTLHWAGRDAPPARVVRRVPDPTEGRSGRSVAPGGTQKYLLAVAVPSKALARAGVRATSAAFSVGSPSGPPPVVVEGVATARVGNEVGAQVWESTLRLRNTAANPVDAVLLATCREPEGARLLLHRRLEAREEVSWVLRTAPLAVADPTAPRLPETLAIVRAELVDWSVIGGGDGGGAEILAEAWRRWVRWDEPFPTVRGRFAFQGPAEAGSASVAVRGAFELDPAGLVALAPDGEVAPGLGDAVRRAVEAAFSPLRRPSATTAVANASPTLVERGRVARVRCEAPPSGERGPPSVWRIEDGVVRGRDDAEAPDSIREDWESIPSARGWLLAGTSLSQRAIRGGAPTDVRGWRYGASSGIPVVLRYVHRSHWTDVADETSIAFEDVRVEGGAAASRPPAAAPEALRAAWEASYRYPDSRIDVAARFVAESPATDGVWRGVRRVEGRLTLRGFSGRFGPAGAWAKANVEVEGKYPPETRAALAAAVEDRLLIWAHRDFAGRPPFDEAFRGATATERAGTPGTYDVANGPCTMIRVADGRVAEWDAPELLGGSLEHATVGTASVAVALRRGSSLARARFVDAGGGWLLPATMRFERIFDAGWGPETLTLLDVRTTAPTED